MVRLRLENHLRQPKVCFLQILTNYWSMSSRDCREQCTLFATGARIKAAVQFSDEYDLQDLFHALLRPWVKDIRPEEYTPSYVGSSTRMDFLLREHKIVCELKFVRSKSHAKRLVGDELTIDIAHYRRHPNCESLYAVIYDPNAEYIANPDGFVCDLESNSENPTVRVFILPTRTVS